MRSIFLKGGLALYCVFVSASAFALPINDFACSQTGGGTVTPNVAEACVVWDIQSNDDLVSYAYSGEAASTGDVVPALSAFNVTGLTLIDRLVIQLDPTLRESDIFNPSAGFIGVGILDGIYGVIFENGEEEFSVTFMMKTIPTLGRFLGLGTTDDGTSFSFNASSVLVPGTQTIDQAIPEPKSLVLAMFGLVGIGAFRKHKKT